MPYDFDFAGMVNAPYAGPNPKLGISKVTTRLYRGLCRNNDLLQSSFDRFQSRREEIYALVADEERLKRSARRKMTKFIDRFYKVLADESLTEREFIKQCSEAEAPPDPT